MAEEFTMVKAEKEHVTFDLMFVGECPIVESQVEEALEKFVATSDIRVQRVVPTEGSVKIWAVAFSHRQKFSEVKRLIHDRGFKHANFEHLVAAKRSNKLSHLYVEGKRVRNYYALGTVAVDSEGCSFAPVMTKFYKDDGDGKKLYWLKMWSEVKSTMMSTRNDTFLIVER